jgi:ubiquitin-conjugating enzyme E2 J2
MHTPSGRFQPSTRLCLSISDFHPKSFNPAWGISTILIGLLSFMTSEEITTGSVHGTEAERKWHAARSRWWNSTGGGSSARKIHGLSSNARGNGAIKSGDGGSRFAKEWPELNEENWKWMKDNKIDPATGGPVSNNESTCSPEAAALRRRPTGSNAGLNAVVEGGQAARNVGQSWIRRNRLMVGAVVLVSYVLLARLLGEGTGMSSA